MKRRPLTKCPKCLGKGKVPLSDELFAVLEVARRNRGATAVSVAKELDPRQESFSPTAFNNRLEQLRSAGFVNRRRVHKAWVYSVK